MAGALLLQKVPALLWGVMWRLAADVLPVFIFAMQRLKRCRKCGGDKNIFILYRLNLENGTCGKVSDSRSLRGRPSCRQCSLNRQAGTNNTRSSSKIKSAETVKIT
ncbi:hypothetical protein CA264_01585 [Pontibacter actiniarum]|uniref:Uncharacterized protein n=1 Tax=Pontibacter actiniarum TaxID=323450 RepID=A0A1X9YN22_9BACT|nr:hypothetical protein CA264_01585 [Pontibacter actiniarum]